MGFLNASLSKYKLTDNEFNKLANHVRKQILSVSQPEKIYIFGSYARDSISGTSDLDLGVIFESYDQLKVQKRIILNSKLFLNQATDILFYFTEDFEKRSNIGGVCAVIKKEGKLIYDKRTKI